MTVRTATEALARANWKLGEAEFFLGRLFLEAREAGHPEPRAFDYYLSAFLSAARSLTVQLGTGPFYAWFLKWKEALEAAQPRRRELLRFMTEQRDAEVHSLGAKVRVEERRVDARLIPGITVVQPSMAAVIAEAARTGKPVNPDHFKTYAMLPDYYFDDPSPARVVDRCTEYLQLLRELRTAFQAHMVPEETPPQVG